MLAVVQFGEEAVAHVDQAEIASSRGHFLVLMDAETDKRDVVLMKLMY